MAEPVITAEMIAPHNCMAPGCEKLTTNQTLCDDCHDLMAEAR